MHGLVLYYNDRVHCTGELNSIRGILTAAACIAFSVGLVGPDALTHPVPFCSAYAKACCQSCAGGT